MTHAQRVAKLESYQKTGMDGKKTHLDLTDEETATPTNNETSSSSANHLPVTAVECGITTIPIAILDAMFEKANHLLDSPANVIPKPGATDGSFIVAGHSNNIHVVTPGKGGSLKCDRSCVNSSTKTCEHILAVAKVRETFNEFLTWYKRSRRGARMLEMTLGSAPKSAGRKPSKRKRTNNEKAPVIEQRDLLVETELDLLSPGSARFPLNAIPPTSTNTINTPDPLHQTGRCDNNSFLPTQQVVSSGRPPCTNSNQIQTQLGSSFRLKWVPGTRVRKCYGCQKEIKNPPQVLPDDLVVVYRDIRQYRDPNDGLVKFTKDPENVHFHLKASCIRARYPNFNARDLVVPPEFPPLFKLEHVQRLVGEFGWVL